jgi:hypothetical protein
MFGGGLLADQLTCFIAAEQGPEKVHLRRQLENRNVTCFSLDSSVSKAPIISVYSFIERSDFVASILSANSSPNLAYELGLAHGLRKPLLLFAHESSSIPFDLASANFLPISLLGSPQWSDYIDAFLKTIYPSKSRLRKASIRKSVGDPRRWREIRIDYEQLLQSDRPAEAGLENLVERAFKQGGFSLSRSPSPDFGADFALATPKLVAVYSLPILVEVKNNSRPHLAQEAINRLSMLIQNGRGGAGLVVTMQPDKATPYLKGAQPIVVVPFPELSEWLRRGTFEEEFLEVVDAFWTRER